MLSYNFSALKRALFFILKGRVIKDDELFVACPGKEMRKRNTRSNTAKGTFNFLTVGTVFRFIGYSEHSNVIGYKIIIPLVQLQRI